MHVANRHGTVDINIALVFILDVDNVYVSALMYRLNSVECFGQDF